MAQEEQNQKGSTSSSGGGGGGRSSKKLKQKKIPQRGLGVAQLEKIRLEEQQKKDPTGIISSSPTMSTSSSSYLSVPLPNYHHNQSSSPVPFRPPLLTDLPSPDSLFRPVPQVPNVDILQSNTVPLADPMNAGSNTVPLPNPMNSSGYEIGWPPVPGLGNVSKLWNSEPNLVGKNSRADPGLAFHANLPYESNPIWPLPNVMQRAHQYQQPCSSMVNVSSAMSSSSVLSFQMEPPSNQSYYGNYTPLWPEEEKMVGMKRPYPFSLEIPPCPSFHCKVPSFVGPISRSDESASCGNAGAHNFDASNRIFREAPSCSTSMSEPYSKDNEENGILNGDFLTLAPPTTVSPYPSSKNKHKPAYSNSYNRELFEFESLPYQGSAEDPICQQEPSGFIQQQQPIYSFFPPAKAQIGQGSTSWNNCNGAGENIDLNLKL